MATLREIRKRIRSVKSIAQVTKAMQTVSASKMRRAQMMTLSTRPYAERSWGVLNNLVAHLSPGQRQRLPLLRRRPVRAIELLVVTANRGLCGGYNHNIIAAAADFAARQTVPVRFVTVGRKGREYFSRHQGEVVGEFSDLPDRPSPDDVRPIVQLLVEDLERGVVDQVWVAYTEFISTLSQRPRLQLLLPVGAEGPEPSASRVPYLFEPDAEAILGPMLRRFTELQVYRAILEGLASEHSARMVAMRSATDNALRLIDELTLGYNKARQEAITKELIDIVGGVAAQQSRAAAAR